MADPQFDRNGTPMPVANNQPPIHDLVSIDIQSRKRLGISRYGTPLQPHNRRDALRDAYEEVLDLAVYLRQLIEERVTPPTRSDENPSADADRRRLLRHLTGLHARPASAELWSNSQLIQEHLNAHRLEAETHVYWAWGER